MAADHHKLVRDGPMGDGNARQRGNCYGTRHTRHNCDRNPSIRTREHLFVAAREHERIAPLEPHDELARLGPVDEHLVDRVLCHRAPVRDLGGVDDLDLRRQFGEQLLRGQPVGDDDVGVGQQAPAAHGDQFRVAGSAADQRDAAVQDARGLGGDHAALQRLVNGRPDRGRPAVLAAGQHPDGQPFVLERGGCDGGALAGHVGAHTEDVPALGLRRRRRR